MKRLNNLIYIAFALIVWGSFANFAQNDYGYMMLHWAWFAIGIILLTEAVINLTLIRSIGAARALYLFSEHFLIALFFLAGFFKFRHFAGAGPMYASSCIFLTLLYIISAFIRLAKDWKHGKALAILIFLVYLSAALAVAALVFKVMHWPFSNLLGFACLVLCPGILLIALLKRKFLYKGESISLFSRLRTLTGRPGLVFGYFNVWVIYISFIVLGLAPDFYTHAMGRPPAAEQLRQKRQDERADRYMENYEMFFQNRWEEESK